jgi:hypothetical protein
MAGSVVQSDVSSDASVSVLTSDALGASVTVGNIVVAHCFISSTSRTIAITDNSASGQTWTALGTMPQSVASSLRRYVWWCEADEAFTTVTFTVSGGSVSSIQAHVIELAGVEAPDETDQYEGTAVSDPLDVGGITTTGADKFLLGVMAKESASEAWTTSPSGWTTVGTTLNRIFACTRDAASVGSYGCTVNWASASTRNVAALFAAFPVTTPGGGSVRRTSCGVI